MKFKELIKGKPRSDSNSPKLASKNVERASSSIVHTSLKKDEKMPVPVKRSIRQFSPTLSSKLKKRGDSKSKLSEFKEQEKATTTSTNILNKYHLSSEPNKKGHSLTNETNNEGGTTPKLASTVVLQDAATPTLLEPTREISLTKTIVECSMRDKTSGTTPTGTIKQQAQVANTTSKPGEHKILSQAHTRGRSHSLSNIAKESNSKEKESITYAKRTKIQERRPLKFTIKTIEKEDLTSKTSKSSSGIYSLSKPDNQSGKAKRASPSKTSANQTILQQRQVSHSSSKDNPKPTTNVDGSVQQISDSSKKQQNSWPSTSSKVGQSRRSFTSEAAKQELSGPINKPTKREPFSPILAKKPNNREETLPTSENEVKQQQQQHQQESLSMFLMKTNKRGKSSSPLTKTKKQREKPSKKQDHSSPVPSMKVRTQETSPTFVLTTKKRKDSPSSFTFETAKMQEDTPPTFTIKTNKRADSPSSFALKTTKKREDSPPTFAIKTKKRPSNIAEKIHVEVSANKERMRSESFKKKKVDGEDEPCEGSPFSSVSQVKLGRVRSETANITCLEKVSNTPLRAKKEYSKPSLKSSPSESFDSESSPNERFYSGRSSTSLGFVENGGGNLSSSSSSETLAVSEVTDTDFTIVSSVSFETLNEISLDDGYHTLSSIDASDPWANYEKDLMTSNLNKEFTKLRSTPNLYGGQTTRDLVSEAMKIDQPVVLRRRPKTARYSYHQPHSDEQNTPLGKGNKFASEAMLTRGPSSKSTDRKRRSKEINRSTTLYWDGAIEAPTLPENLVFNVSMNAKIQTCYKDTIMHTAAANGNKDIVRFYADSEQYLNTQNGFRNTPLHCAIIGKHEEIVSLLIDKDLDLTLQNIDGDTILHLLLRVGFTKYAEKAISKDNINFQNKDGDTPLHIAVRQNNKDVIMKLMQYHPILNVQNNQGDTPLHLCQTLDVETKLALFKPIENHNHDYVSEVNQLDGSNGSHVSEMNQLDVMSKDIHISETNQLDGSKEYHVTETNQSENDCIINMKNSKGETILHVLASNNDVTILTAVMALECLKTKVRNTNGETALHLAAKHSIELINLVAREDIELLNMGDCNEDTILHYAIKSPDLTLTEELLHLGININAQNKLGNTPLHYAAIGRQSEILRLLCSKNADLNVKNQSKDGPLHLIAGCFDDEVYQVMRELLVMQNPADIIKAVSMRNAFGNTPLHEAVIQNDIEFFQIFIDYAKSFMNSANIDGNTILHLIAELNRARFLRFIDLANTDINILNREGLSAWNISIQKERSDIAMFLLKHKWNLILV